MDLVDGGVRQQRLDDRRDIVLVGQHGLGQGERVRPLVRPADHGVPRLLVAERSEGDDPGQSQHRRVVGQVKRYESSHVRTFLPSVSISDVVAASPSARHHGRCWHARAGRLAADFGPWSSRRSARQRTAFAELARGRGVREGEAAQRVPVPVVAVLVQREPVDREPGLERGQLVEDLVQRRRRARRGPR